MRTLRSDQRDRPAVAGRRTKLRREASLDALAREVEGEPLEDREIGASGQPMRTVAEIEAMPDDVLRNYVRSLVPGLTVD